MSDKDIKFIKADIALSIGDVIEDSPTHYKVVYIDYFCSVVVILNIENNIENNTDIVSFSNISKSFQRDINDVKVHKEDIIYDKATISLNVGDDIVDADGNYYNIDAIEYDNVTVFCSQFAGEVCHTFPFSAFSDGNYKRVVR